MAAARFARRPSPYAVGKVDGGSARFASMRPTAGAFATNKPGKWKMVASSSMFIIYRRENRPW